MTRALHQFVPNLAAGDAIGVHVRLTQAALRAAGWESEIFYDEVHPSMRKLGRHYSTFDRAVDGRDGDAWIFFQLSTGSRLTSFALDQDLPLGVLYFNVTPPVFFDRWEPAAADNLRAALTDVRRLAASSRFAIGNSTFSEHELVAAGYSPTAVCPVLFDLKELDVPANDRLMQRLRRQTQEGGSRWLFIGRVAPNKCQHDLIASFAAYRELYDDKARLTIVGGRTSNVYFRSLSWSRSWVWPTPSSSPTS
jgi:glycosyltransferase involved in cell wall biosynthesis